MRGIRLVLAACLALLHTASAQEASWVNVYGVEPEGRYWDQIEIASIAPAPGGGFLAVGNWKTWTRNPRAWLGKIGPTGLLEWQRVASESQETRAYAVRGTGGGYVVAGAAHPGPNVGLSAWLFAVDPDGNPLWQRRFASRSFSQGPTALIVRADGTYVAVGKTWAYEKSAAWLLRLGGDGAVITSTNYQLRDVDSATGVAESPEGGHVVVGATRGSSDEESRPFILKVDATGTPVAGQQFVAASGQFLSVIPVAAGGYLVGGAMNRFARLNRLGGDLSLQWQRFLPGLTLAWPERVVVRETAGGGFTVAGSGNAYPAHGAFVFRVDASGAAAAELVYQPQALDPRLMDVVVGPDGSELAVGSSPGIADESLVSWALRVGSAGARNGCPEVAWVPPPAASAGFWSASQVEAAASASPVSGGAEPLVLEVAADLRGFRTCPAITDPLPFDWSDAADVWHRCVVSPGSTGDPVGGISRCAPQGCPECTYSFAEGVDPGKLSGPVVDLYAGLKGPSAGSPPVPKDPPRLASLLERVPTGRYCTGPLREGLVRDLAKGFAAPGALARVVNAIELDQAVPRLAPRSVAVGASRSVTADFGSIAWLDFRRVAKPGRASLEIAAGIPARLADYRPLWPLVTYRFRTDASLAKGGYVDLTFSTGGLPIRRPAAVRVLEWDGKRYRDVTRGTDGQRGVVSARTDKLREYVLMLFAPGAFTSRADEKARPSK